MIPVTRQPKPHRHADTFPFAAGERWRPPGLVLDDDTPQRRRGCMNGQRKITGGGEAVTAVNAEGGEIDATAWRWDVEEDGEPRTVVVQVTGQAATGNDARPDVAEALESHGRSVVEEIRRER